MLRIRGPSRPLACCGVPVHLALCLVHPTGSQAISDEKISCHPSPPRARPWPETGSESRSATRAPARRDSPGRSRAGTGPGCSSRSSARAHAHVSRSSAASSAFHKRKMAARIIGRHGELELSKCYRACAVSLAFWTAFTNALACAFGICALPSRMSLNATFRPYQLSMA